MEEVNFYYLGRMVGNLVGRKGWRQREAEYTCLGREQKEVIPLMFHIP